MCLEFIHGPRVLSLPGHIHFTGIGGPLCDGFLASTVTFNVAESGAKNGTISANYVA